MGSQTRPAPGAEPGTDRRSPARIGAHPDAAPAPSAAGSAPGRGPADLDGPLSFERLERIQQSAGNRAAWGLVEQRRNGGAGPGASHRTAPGMGVIQRAPGDPPDAAGPAETETAGPTEATSPSQDVPTAEAGGSADGAESTGPADAAAVAETASPVAPATPQDVAAAEGASRDDPARLPEGSEEGLIDLYQTDEQLTTLADTGATYSLGWVRGSRGSAQIRDALRVKLAAIDPADAERRSAYLYGLVDLAAGPEERARQLRALIDASLVPRERLGEELTGGGKRHLTGYGYIMELPVPAARTNQSNRPKFLHQPAVMVAYEGALVHPAVVAPLTALLAGLRAEGARLNDESALRAEVNNGWRGTTQSEGNRYLSSLRKTITKANDRAATEGRPPVFPPFPTALERMATSELGFSGSPAHRAFERALAASPGWTAGQADRLLGLTGLVKAPRGGSTHHSGLTVDIDWPVWKGRDRGASRHGIDRDNNEAALGSVAGRWLYQHAAGFGFASYDTGQEIWHMEWLDWKGSEADPDAESGAAGDDAAEGGEEVEDGAAEGGEAGGGEAQGG